MCLESEPRRKKNTPGGVGLGVSGLGEWGSTAMNTEADGTGLLSYLLDVWFIIIQTLLGRPREQNLVKNNFMAE